MAVAGTSLAVQWLRFHASIAGGPGLFPGQGTRSHTMQLTACICPLPVTWDGGEGQGFKKIFLSLKKNFLKGPQW